MARDAPGAHDGRLGAGPVVGRFGPGRRISHSTPPSPGRSLATTTRPAGSSWHRRSRTAIMPRTPPRLSAAGCTGCWAAPVAAMTVKATATATWTGPWLWVLRGRGCGLCSGLGQATRSRRPGCGGGHADIITRRAGSPRAIGRGAGGHRGPLHGRRRDQPVGPVGMAVVQPSCQSPCGSMAAAWGTLIAPQAALRALPGQGPPGLGDAG